MDLIFLNSFVADTKAIIQRKMFSVELLCKRDEGIGIPDECYQYHHLK
jgi:hypothetical protein